MFVRVILFTVLNFILYFGNFSQAKDNIIQNNIYCEGKETKFFLSKNKIETISVDINNLRSWYRNLFKVISEFNSNETKTTDSKFFKFNIDSKYKKKYDSQITIKFENGPTCKFKGNIRLTGDLWWHLDWRQGTPISSMEVTLYQGHVNNITTFKLLLPNSRNSENEIFVTSLLEEINILSPLTFFIYADVNGKKVKYIFQEDLRKEFLESKNLIEGPILEGDERFTIDNHKKTYRDDLSLARLDNTNYAIKNKLNLDTSIFSISKLNKAYIDHSNSNGKNLNFMPLDKLFINTNYLFDKKENLSKFQIYESLMYALDSQHNLSIDDRRFYFDPIFKYFRPIYYDGKSKILEKNQSLPLNKLILSSSVHAKEGAKKALNLIKNLNDKKILLKLENRGLSMKTSEYNKVINKIIKRLESLANSNPNIVVFEKEKLELNEIKNNMVKGKEIRLIYINGKENKIKICDINSENCIEFITSTENYKELISQIISQRFNKKSLSVFNQLAYKNNKNFPFNNYHYLFIYDQSEIFKKNNHEMINIDGEFNIFYNNGIDINIDKNNKNISFIKSKIDGRAFINGSMVENWNISFIDKSEINNNYLGNHHNLTGCLTFVDIEIKNLSLSTQNTKCEDGINFIRSNGTIEKIDILNSKSDGVDFDFSKLQIKNVFVNSSNGDCLDFSFGNYELKNIILKNCGDKAISIGEKSKLKGGEIKIEKAVTGIASKDSSDVILSNVLVQKTKNCFSAYRKKQEFSGSILRVNNYECSEFQNKVSRDKNSIVILNKK